MKFLKRKQWKIKFVGTLKIPANPKKPQRTLKKEKPHSNYNELWIFSLENLKTERTNKWKMYFYSRNSQQNKMPFNNLAWLSDKRNVWTRKLISDFKIFQSFLSIREAESKKINCCHEARTSQSLSSSSKKKTERRTRCCWLRSDARKDVGEIFIGEFVAF